MVVFIKMKIRKIGGVFVALWSNILFSMLNLSKVLFWDTDFNKIDFQKNARYVIEKVVMYGNVSDWRSIQHYYGMEKIKKEVLQSRHLDEKTLSFLSCIFEIPKSQFRCYTMKQFSPTHLDF